MYDNPAYTEPLRKQDGEDFSKDRKKKSTGSLPSGASSNSTEYCTTEEAVTNRIREFLSHRRRKARKKRLHFGRRFILPLFAVVFKELPSKPDQASGDPIIIAIVFNLVPLIVAFELVSACCVNRLAVVDSADYCAVR